MQLIIEQQEPRLIAAALAEQFDFASADALCMKACYNALLSPDATYVFFSRYAAINGFAGPLVARLASAIGLSRGTFIDQDEYPDIADKDMLVAQQVFSATIDEFGDAGQRGLTHRTLAQATVEAAAQFAGLSRYRRRELAQLPVAYQPLLESFIRDYQGEVGNARRLVYALGYHLASELRADREYALIDEVFLHSSWGKDFKAWLNEHKRVSLFGEALPSWYWVATHGHYGGNGVEWQHFDAALVAIRGARRYSPLPSAEFDALVAEGFGDFIRLINDTFSLLASECEAVAASEEAQV